PPGSPWSESIWAPELHAISGRWYIYFTAAHPWLGNPSHRPLVLVGPQSSVPPSTPGWAEEPSLIKGLDPDMWGIDASPLALDGVVYLVFSAWMPGVEPDTAQVLWLARLEAPDRAAGPGRCIYAPGPEEWEGVPGTGRVVVEGPEWVESPDGRWRGLVYSGGGSWTPEYAMGALEYVGGDVENPSSWKPCGKILRGGGGVYGVGHGCFVRTPLGEGEGKEETVCVFHGTDGATGGWEGRKARAVRVRWGPQGPDLGGKCGEPCAVEGFVRGDGRRRSVTEKVEGWGKRIHRFLDEL
ncbi:Arabinanase/levansucrase/invertase, partial [Trichodelitschia bisporula]